MPNESKLLQFANIRNLYKNSQLIKEPIYEDFDFLILDELNLKGVKKMMPPHRRNFFTIIFLEDQRTGRININQSQLTALNNTILFQSSEHIFSFVRDENVRGVVVLFHKSFLLPFVKQPDTQFPFFKALNQNLFHLNKTELSNFKQLFHVMHTEKGDASVAKPLLLALLEKALTLYETYSSEEKFLSKKARTVRKYKNLINSSFLESREVRYYAERLNVSANYLNEIVKSETGISAKKHITARLLLEAQNLLRYSEMDIAEISYVLQFSEPTHFTKFFKKETGLTPKSFQSKSYQSS